MIFERILLIDDDSINNHLNKHVIKSYFKPYSIEIISFTDPQAGFQYIANSCDEVSNAATLLLLDINMPILSGWDLLNKLKELNRARLSYMTTYMLSSSIDPDDIHKATSNPLVEGFISKPLAPHLALPLGETLRAKQEPMATSAVLLQGE